jgi:hypothetical protein
MNKYSFVGRTVLEWDQYVFVHDITDANAESLWQIKSLNHAGH